MATLRPARALGHVGMAVVTALAVAAPAAASAAPAAALTAPAAPRVAAPRVAAPEAVRTTATPGIGVLAAYSLVAPRSQAESGLTARAVIPAATACPRLTVTLPVPGRPSGTLRAVALPMTVRPVPATTAPAFSALTVCQADLPRGARTASIAGRPIPAHLPSIVDAIAVFGDTGCRVSGSRVQDCSSPTEWPLSRVAQRIATRDPDVVVFVGDVFYREGACPADQQARCGSSPPPVAGMPFTDSAYGWLAEWLVPMAPVFASAPIVAVRGNHEACNRAGNGWFQYLDAYDDSAATCAPVRAADGTLTAAAPSVTPTWAVDLRLAPGRALRLVVVDSAYGDDTAVSTWAAQQRPAYVAADRLAAPAPGRETWLLTHRPLFGVVSDTFAPPDKPLWTPWTSVDQQAAAVGLLDRFAAIWSSHEHLVQAVQVPGQPPQIVMGNGGTQLDPQRGYVIPQYGALADASGAPLVAGAAPYPTASSLWTDVRFGYALVTPGTAQGAWTVTHYTPADQRFAACSLARRSVACRPLG